MKKFFTLLSRICQNLLPACLFTALALYFIWNRGEGSHGTKAAVVYTQQLKEAQKTLSQAKLEEDNWTNHVKSLGPQALDRDLLDERSRAMLNHSTVDEIIIPYPATAPGGTKGANQ